MRGRPLVKRLAVAAVASSALLAGCVQYGGYNPSYTVGWTSANAGYAAAGGAESDRIAINRAASTAPGPRGRPRPTRRS